MRQNPFLTLRCAFIVALALMFAFVATADSRRSRTRFRTSGYDVVDMRMHRAGELEEAIDDVEFKSVRVLILSGPINGKDLAFIKKIAQRSSVYDYDNRKVDNYLDLDLGDAYIESGGGGFFSSSRTSRDELPSSCFSGCGNLRTVILPEHTSEIGNYAFSNCYNLEEVVMGRRVVRIGDNAFYGCSHLKYLDMSDYVEELGASCFEDCSRLTAVYLPRGLRSIGDKCFKNVPITRLEMPTSLTYLGTNALSGTKLVELYIPADTEIGNNNPGNISTLRAYVVERGNRRYMSDAGLLYNADGTLLISCPEGISGQVNIPNGVEAIGQYAFYNCSRISYVALPASITRIGSYAFANSGVTAFELPENVTVLPAHALEECDGLRSVTLHDGVTTIGSYALANCHNLPSIELPASLSSINEHAFYRCYALQAIDIPEGITELPQSAFQDCTAMTDITLSDHLTTLGKEALRNCKSLQSVQLPASLRSIGIEVFRDCKVLQSIDIPEGVTSIGTNAFRSTALTELILPSTVTNIGKKITEKCKLQRIECRAITPPVLEKENDSKVPLFVPAESIAAYKNAKQWKNFKQINPL